MRWVTAALGLPLALVWAELLAGGSGLRNVLELRQQLGTQVASNNAAVQRNQRLQSEVADLRDGHEMVEEVARAELSMLKPDEILVKVTRRR